ncbi:MAG: hypothetical protein AB1791_17305 [Chloroflexota bacterium]
MKSSSIFRPSSFVLVTAVSFLLALTASLTSASVDLYNFYAIADQSSITLVWDTAQELNNLGFNLWRDDTRSLSDCHAAAQVNAGLIPSQAGGQATGAHYEYLDSNVQVGVTYRYWVESVDTSGLQECHAPIEVSLNSGGAISTPVAGGGGGAATSTSAPPSPATQTPVPPATALPTATPGGRATNTPAATPTAEPSGEQPTATLVGVVITPLPPTPTPDGGGSDDGGNDPATPPSESSLTPLPAAVGGRPEPTQLAAVASSGQLAPPTPGATNVVGQGQLASGGAATANPQPAGLLGGRLSVLSILILLSGAALLLLGGILAAWFYLSRRKSE